MTFPLNNITIDLYIRSYPNLLYVCKRYKCKYIKKYDKEEDDDGLYYCTHLKVPFSSKLFIDEEFMSSYIYRLGCKHNDKIVKYHKLSKI